MRPAFLAASISAKVNLPPLSMTGAGKCGRSAIFSMHHSKQYTACCVMDLRLSVAVRLSQSCTRLGAFLISIADIGFSFMGFKTVSLYYIGLRNAMGKGIHRTGQPHFCQTQQAVTVFLITNICFVTVFQISNKYFCHRILSKTGMRKFHRWC